MKTFIAICGAYCLFIGSVAAHDWSAVNSKIKVIQTGNAKFTGPNIDIDVKYNDHGFVNLFEGDLVVDANANNNQASIKSVVVASNSYLWPNKTLYYAYYTNNPSLKTVTRQAMQRISEVSGVKFQEVFMPTTQNHVKIMSEVGKGCYSWLGYRAIIGQNLNLDPDGCLTKTIGIHELMHALGFAHEHSRADRDNFIFIDYANIIPEYKYAFDQGGYFTKDVGNYDYSSIMHYGRYAFTANGLPTITPLIPGAQISSNGDLSLGDIVGLNAYYPKDPIPLPANKTIFPIFDLLLD